MTQAHAATLLLEARKDDGVTWRELAAVEHMHHGSASRVLSDLHRTGHTVRLTDELRDGCAVYVLSQYAGVRRARPYEVRRAPEPEDAAAMAARVLGVVTRWGLDGSRFPTMHALAADLRRAVNRPHPDDVLTLGANDA